MGSASLGPQSAPLKPYVPAEQRVAELTLRAVVLGAILSVTFGMVNAYLGLKIGLTVSASIPSAVLSMSILRGLLRRGTILENNVVHTVASAGESLAAGVVFTAPALLFIGLDPGGFYIFLIAATAGLLGVFMMIPLRQQLTIAEHHLLPFPEGTACAKVLIAGDRGRTAARPVFLGLLLGAGYQFAMRALRLWHDTVFFTAAGLHKISFGAELTPLLLGVGYLVGPRVAAVLAGGGALAWMVLIPLFDLLGGTTPGSWLGIGADVAQLDAWGIWRKYVRFVGAGGVACGGAISIVRALPVIVESLRRSFGRQTTPGARRERLRTECDLPTAVVIGGSIALALALWLIPAFDMGLAQTLLAVGLTYFFVVVSARMVGIVGSTSQPISGMTITALLTTTFVLKGLGYEGQTGIAASLAVAVIVCVAVALAGDVSQDLKCGALVGATPRALQIGEMIGVASAAVRAGWVLFLLHQAYTIGSELLPAPQAKLMATLAEGVMRGELPWGLLLLGAGLAAVAELAGVSSLAFAIGLYLPFTTTSPLIIGGLLSRWLDRRRNGNEPVTLLASGLIAGDALMGIAIAALVIAGWDRLLALRDPTSGAALEVLATLLPFALLALLVWRAGRRHANAHPA
jgi:putative OPT family oligopeptide transporter